jgi:S1-C subfamily serine protease
MYEDDEAWPEPRRGRVLLVFFVVGIFAAAAGVGCTLLVHAATTVPAQKAAAVMPAGAAMNDSAVYSKVEPGVVDVSANLQYLDETAEGTGFVIDAAHGLVLTNNHVIDGATSVIVTPVTSGRSYPATVVGYDLTDDVAVLKIKGASGLKAVETGDSAKLSIGAQVLALGNEAGQGGPPSVAPGVISSMGRSIVASDQSSGLTETLHGMLQTSADIRPGDSGGPLADSAGQVVGIDTAAGSGGPGTSVAGYAIPINTALSIGRQIAAERSAPGIALGMPAFLGVLLPDSSSTSPEKQADEEAGRPNGAAGRSGRSCLTSDASAAGAVPAAIAPVKQGALVDGVVCGTPAADAGLVAGDVITGLGGHTVTSASALTSILNRERPDTRAMLTWVTVDGVRHSSPVTLETGPAG